MATYTEKLNLKLPDYTDPADVQDLNENFQKIDTYASQTGGKVSSVTVNGTKHEPDSKGNVDLGTIQGGTAKDSEKLGGKAPEAYLTTDKVVNNFTTTAEGYVADARALKVLNDKFTRTGYTPTFSGCKNNNLTCYKVSGLVVVSGRIDIGDTAISNVTSFITGLPPGANMDLLAIDMSSAGEHVRVQFIDSGVVRTVYTTLKANQQYSLNFVYIAS